MDLAEKRRALRHLLDERDAADAMAAYYAFYHPDDKTQLFLQPPDAARAQGYVAVSRTGIDLFRPLLTMRLPLDDLNASTTLIHNTLRPGTPVIIHVPDAYGPLIHALFAVNVEEQLRVYALDRGRFEPVINVLVVQSTTPDGLPRFIIRSQTEGGQVVASAGLNWQSRYFADIAVNTDPSHRRQGWGRSVVAAMVQHLLESGRTPLYVVAAGNTASMQLAESVGFVDTGVRRFILQGTLKPPPETL